MCNKFLVRRVAIQYHRTLDSSCLYLVHPLDLVIVSHRLVQYQTVATGWLPILPELLSPLFKCFTSGLPQSHTSSLSWMPFPHTGSPMVVVGVFVRQCCRLEPNSPSTSSSLLHELHVDIGVKPGESAAMMHDPVGSLQVHEPVRQMVY